MGGSQYNRKTIWKNGAMLHYIKVLLWTPAECMQRGARRKKGKIDVLLLLSNSAASQRCWKLGNSNLLFVNIQQLLKWVCQLWYMVQQSNNMSSFSLNLTDDVTFTLLIILQTQGAFKVGQRKLKVVHVLPCFFPELHHWSTRRLLYNLLAGNFQLKTSSGMHCKSQISYLITNGEV